MRRDIFRRKTFLDFNDQSTQPVKLKKVLTSLDLVMLGVGAIIGAGIFVITGIAAATKGGPAITISYLIAALACAFSALSYAELASSVGGCGSAYGYAYVSLGEIVAWIIGWDLLLEYAISVSAVSVGWSEYLVSIFNSYGWHVSGAFLKGPLEGGIVNLPAVGIIFFTAILLIIGVKESARFNFLMVSVKLLVLAIFIFIAVQNINPSYWHPFMPFGWNGIMSGAALIFFAYIGFDAVSTAAEEVIDQQRSMPIGIIGSLLICTVLYVVVAALLTGVADYKTLNISSPISTVLIKLGYPLAASFVGTGALAGITTVIIVMYYGMTRIIYAMSRDRLVPTFFSKINSNTRTPVRIIIVSGILMCVISALLPISDLAELVNIGTLSAFIIVCSGVIILKYKKTEMKAGFKTPYNPLIPGLGIIFCLYLIFSLPAITLYRFVIWMTVGLIVYFFYGRYHSILNTSKS